MSTGDIKKELNSFIECTEKSEMSVMSLADNFDQLRRKVESYIMDIEAESETLKSQLREKENLGRLRRQEKKLKKFIANFNASEGALQGLILHVGALSYFWEAVRADCQSATIHLTRVDAREATTEFQIRTALGTELAGSAYLILSETLATYSREFSSLES